MKTHFTKLALFAALLAFCATTQAQKPRIETYNLSNGLRVVLAEEHSQPKVYGGMLVHAGSKNEDPNITGVAHYFEHMMFKGTDRIGTTDWASESLYLDSISHQYDLLHATSDEKERHAIQKEINRLNIAASKYAIPNEVDAILSKIGSTGVNAGTSYDYTVYYNAFPSNQMQNWLDIYKERFRYPVFRLFQSELEAVYEEKNMYEDSPIYAFRRQMFKECFGEHPYSRDVIGLGEHLKNPQPSEMRRFFNTYYVANNMTLALIGDFKIEEVKPMIEEAFSSLPQRELPARPTYQMPKFEKQTITEVKMTPIPLGMIVFPGVKANDPDELTLSIISSILSGGSGILDRASSQGRLMMAQYTNGSLEDGGINLVMYMPTLLKQSHADAEMVVWDCLDSLKQGNFSDELLESIKVRELLVRKSMIENLDGLASLIQQLELSGYTYEKWLAEGERIQNLTRDEIIATAKKYFDANHCSIVRSKMGFPKKDEVAKPDWDHLNAQNIGAQSEFATDIYNRAISPVEPQEIKIGKDVVVTPINPYYTLYSNKNPKNDIFTLTINYDYGSMDDPDLDRAAAYFESIGSGDLDLEAFRMQMELLGASVDVHVNEASTSINIRGYDENLDKIIALVRTKFDNPHHDSKQIDLIVDNVKAEAKSAKSDAHTWFQALTEYVRYGQQSSSLSHTPIKEWKAKADGEHLMQEFQMIFLNGGHVTYTGNLSDKEVAQSLIAHNFIPSKAAVQPIRGRKMQLPNENQVVYVHNKKFGQSNIMIIIPTLEIAPEDRAVAEVFNEYFGGGMNSIIFQEIREFRSLGYSTYGRYLTDERHINGGQLLTYLGTQCDKTFDGIEALTDLMTNVPMRADKFVTSRDFKAIERNGNYIDFREQPQSVYQWMHVMGLKADPRADITAKVPSITMEDMQRFIDKYVTNRPKTIIISGNAKRFKAKDLAKYGKVTRLKQADIMRF